MIRLGVNVGIVFGEWWWDCGELVGDKVEVEAEVDLGRVTYHASP